MRRFFLYKERTVNPRLLLVLDGRSWIVPFFAPFETGKKRLAVEVRADDAGITRPFRSAPDLIESGEVVFNKEKSRKIDFTVPEKPGFCMGGDFVLVMPSWGRHTKRRLWVIVKVRSRGKISKGAER